MLLYEVPKSRGYSFRQHLEEESWTSRKLTVVDLNDSQRSALEHGGTNSLKETMNEQGLWSFPAMDIEEPLPIQPDVILAQDGQVKAIVIAPKDKDHLMQMAYKFIDDVFQQFGVKLILSDDKEADLSLLKKHDELIGLLAFYNGIIYDLGYLYASYIRCQT
jgi:hypothetical protein